MTSIYDHRPVQHLYAKQNQDVDNESIISQELWIVMKNTTFVGWHVSKLLSRTK